MAAIFTTDDIVTIFNSVGFNDLAEATQSLTLSKSFIDAGFTDPTLFTPVLKRFKLLDQKMKLQTQAAILTADQQTQIQKLVETTNPPIGDLNNQVAAIDAELAQLQA